MDKISWPPNSLILNEPMFYSLQYGNSIKIYWKIKYQENRHSLAEAIWVDTVLAMLFFI